MNDELELRNKIIKGAIEAYREKALKFTMDDIAKSQGISKKTIYTVFKDKEALLLAIVDQTFDNVKIAEKKVYDNKDLTLVEQIRGVLSVMPETYKDVDFSKLYDIKEKYPVVYKQIEYRMETGWEKTLSLIEEGIEQGLIRDCNLQLFKAIYESTMEQFYQRNLLEKTNLTYQEALNGLVDILIEGILVR